MVMLERTPSVHIVMSRVEVVESDSKIAGRSVVVYNIMGSRGGGGEFGVGN